MEFECRNDYFVQALFLRHLKIHLTSKGWVPCCLKTPATHRYNNTFLGALPIPLGVVGYFEFASIIILKKGHFQVYMLQPLPLFRFQAKPF